MRTRRRRREQVIVAIAFLPQSYDESYADPIREREHGRAADGDVPGPRPEYTAGKNNDDACCEIQGIDTRKFERVECVNANK